MIITAFFWAIVLAYLIYERSFFYRTDREVQEETRKLVEAGDYETLIAEPRNFRGVSKHWYGTFYYLRKIDARFATVVLMGREYFIDTAYGTAPAVIRETNASKENPKRTGTLLDIDLMNEVLKELYEEKEHKVEDSFFREAENKYEKRIKG